MDSSVVVSAFRSRLGASSRLLGLVEDGRLVPLATPALFLEYEDVLKRPEQREASGLSLAEVDTALTALSALTRSRSRYGSLGARNSPIPATKWCWTRR